MSSGQGEDEWLNMLRSEMAGLPSDYAACRDRLIELRRLFHEELARTIEPRLNEAIQSRPQFTYEDKQSLASWVNREVREVGLCVRGPKTGAPGILTADDRDRGTHASRFRVVERPFDGSRVYTNMRELADLRLRYDIPRLEGATEKLERKRGIARSVEPHSKR